LHVLHVARDGGVNAQVSLRGEIRLVEPHEVRGPRGESSVGVFGPYGGEFVLRAPEERDVLQAAGGGRGGGGPVVAPVDLGVCGDEAGEQGGVVVGEAALLAG